MDRRAKIILTASLVANLFLAGALVGALVVGSRMIHDRTEVRRGERPGVWSAVQSIPPERRRMMREFMRDQAREAAPDLRAAREARQAAAQLIALPVYDAAAVEGALKRGRESDSLARAKVDAALAARLAQLTPEERAAFAQVMLRGPRGGGMGRGGPRGERGPGGGPPPDGEAQEP